MKTGELRIIGGAWRSRRIRFPDRPGLRPTPDRVRETLFNWLGQDLTGRDCLDLYAGSGALGFEAASRGARRVVMVERDAAALRALQANRALLDAAAVAVVCADALEFLQTSWRSLSRRVPGSAVRRRSLAAVAGAAAAVPDGGRARILRAGAGAG